MKPPIYVEATRQWIEQVVIGLNLCPFAAAPFRQGKIRYVLEESPDPEQLRRTLLAEWDLLLTTPADQVETSLIIHPNVLREFSEYLDFLVLAEELLLAAGLEGVFQLASFHPEYRFAGVPAGDAANYSNRSPYAMLHVLREQSVETALDNYSDPEQIPQRNIRRLRELGVENILLRYPVPVGRRPIGGAQGKKEVEP